jgi:hypothetical protein
MWRIYSNPDPHGEVIEMNISNDKSKINQIYRNGI